MSPIRVSLLAFCLVFLLPLLAHAAWWLAQDQPSSWGRADWSSAHLLPPAAQHRPALVRVYAARTGRWKGIFAHHSWIVVKPAGADRYTRFDKVGWGSPVRTDGWAADGRWYGNPPELVAALDGAAAEAAIPRIRAAVEAYPHRGYGAYRVWPGPNSNTFVAHVMAAVPEMQAALPPTALGKDWPDEILYLGRTPSGTGLRLSLLGVLGVQIGWVEGIELNLASLVAGLDLRRPAVKLPGFGRLGIAATP